MIEIRLPQFGMGMTDGTITAWHKAEGDAVIKGELLCDIEAAKTTVEMECPETGILRKIIVKPDENVAVNTVIAEMDLQGAQSDTDVSSMATPVALDAPPVTAPSAPVPDAMNVQVEPSARRLARELGVDLTRFVGSGPGGRILLADVQKVAAAKVAHVIPTSTPERVAGLPDANAETGAKAAAELPHTMARRTIARRLTESKQQVPHFYLKSDMIVDELIALRKRVNVDSLISVSINDLIVRAVALTLHELSALNVSWGENSMVQHSNVDVAVAVASPRGLVTPIVVGAQHKSARSVAVELKDLISRAREGKLKQHEYQGGTVSMSNMGMLGVQEFTAIINPPQSLIFAIGSSELRPVVVDGKLSIATCMTVTMSIDHRAIDGALAAKGLAVFKGLIESPTPLVG